MTWKGDQNGEMMGLLSRVLGQVMCLKKAQRLDVQMGQHASRYFAVRSSGFSTLPFDDCIVSVTGQTSHSICYSCNGQAYISAMDGTKVRYDGLTKRMHMPSDNSFPVSF